MSAADRLAQVILDANSRSQSAEPMYPHEARELAAVVLAHLTAEGWAQGREERTMRMEAFDTPHGPGIGSVWYRRRVTDWEPVDA